MAAVGFPEKTWLLDRDELFELYTPDADQPFPPECGIRVVHKNPAATGYREFVLLEEGLAVICSDVHYREPITIEHPDRPIVKFHYRLSGRSGLDFDNRSSAAVPEHVGSALLLPSTLKKREVTFAGKREQSVTVACSPHWLTEHFGADLERAPPSLQRYARGDCSEFFFLPIAMRSGISQAAGAFLACELGGHVRRMFFMAKAIEILALSLDVLITEQTQPEHVEHRISKRDFEQLREARRILHSDISTVLKVDELAARIGMNESRMMQLFKRLYGETVFDFSQRVRMEFAAKLLEATDRSITEIAFEVGYDYPSNFTTAFKRHFGVPPRSVRQSGAPPPPKKR